MQFKWEIRALSPALSEYNQCCLHAFTSVSTMWDVQYAYLSCIFRKDPRQWCHECSKYPTSGICGLLWILNGLWGLWPLLTLIELPSLIKFGKEWWHPQWGLRTRCRLMNAVQVGDPSLITCSQWVQSMLFACFHFCEYNVGCPVCIFELYIP